MLATVSGPLAAEVVVLKADTRALQLGREQAHQGLGPRWKKQGPGRAEVGVGQPWRERAVTELDFKSAGMDMGLEKKSQHRYKEREEQEFPGQLHSVRALGRSC